MKDRQRREWKLVVYSVQRKKNNKESTYRMGKRKQKKKNTEHKETNTMMFVHRRKTTKNARYKHITTIRLPPNIQKEQKNQAIKIIVQILCGTEEYPQKPKNQLEDLDKGLNWMKEVAVLRNKKM